MAPFAHESERILASLFSLYSINWEYEPHEFVLESDEYGQTRSSFRPDFYLPRQNLYVELTVMRQPLVTSKNRKVRNFRERYPHLTLLMIYRKGFERLIETHGIDPKGAL